jgi:carbonic anhydrase
MKDIKNYLRTLKRELGTYRAVAQSSRLSITTVFNTLNPRNYQASLEKQRKRNKLFPKKRQKYNREASKRYNARHPERVMLRTAKNRAKSNGVKFSLREADIHIPEKCPVLGITLVKHFGVHRDNSPSLDRVNPKLGYTKNNIEVISHLANSLKRDQTDPQIFEAIAKYLRRHKQ